MPSMNLRSTLGALLTRSSRWKNPQLGRKRLLYAQAAWSGFRPFVVFRREQESDEITSFYLKPSDGGPVCHFEPGQYVSVKRFVKEIGVEPAASIHALRNAPNWGVVTHIGEARAAAGYRLPGFVSNLIHEGIEVGGIVEVSAPMGEFTLEGSQDDARRI